MRERPRILVVDDDPDIRRFIELGLQKKGYETIGVESGEEALRAAQLTLPDLILLDIVLPGINGMHVCHQIKSRIQSFVPIILVTVKGDIQTKMDGIDKGADDFLTKPFVLEELYTKVQAMLRIKKKHDALEQSSITDPLTGAYNRRYFELRIQEESERSKRTKEPFSCIMIDLDHFKKINDQFGHLVGDAALMHIVRLITGLTRKTDILVRYGGEEFILILPNTPFSVGEQMAEILRSTISANPLHWNNDVIKMTVSMGVGAFPLPSVTSSNVLLRYIDNALYKAKKAGRNRVQPIGLFDSKLRANKLTSNL